MVFIHSVVIKGNWKAADCKCHMFTLRKKCTVSSISGWRQSGNLPSGAALLLLVVALQVSVILHSAILRVWIRWRPVTSTTMRERESRIGGNSPMPPPVSPEPSRTNVNKWLTWFSLISKTLWYNMFECRWTHTFELFWLQWSRRRWEWPLNECLPWCNWNKWYLPLTKRMAAQRTTITLIDIVEIMQGIDINWYLKSVVGCRHSRSDRQSSELGNMIGGETWRQIYSDYWVGVNTEAELLTEHYNHTNTCH